MLIHIVINKVDSDTRLKWEETLDYTRIPLWKNCEESLNRRFQHLCAQEATSSRVKLNRPDREGTVRRGSKTALSVAQTEQAADPKCVFCKASNHSIHSCPSFESLPFINRFKFVKGFPLCLNCLKKGHNVSVCKSAHCRVCSKPHHTLLHKFVPESSALIAPLQHEQAPETDSSSQSPPASCNHMFGKKSEQVILATALVKVRGRSGGYHLARVLLDSGAQVNFVTEELANSLKLPKLRKEIRVLGIGNLSSSSQHKVETSVASRVGTFEMSAEFSVLKTISSYQPERAIAPNEVDNQIIYNWQIHCIINPRE
ncbi:hypothetical protein ACLKA6_010490 [Drosophila palustris]